MLMSFESLWDTEHLFCSYWMMFIRSEFSCLLSVLPARIIGVTLLSRSSQNQKLKTVLILCVTLNCQTILIILSCSHCGKAVVCILVLIVLGCRNIGQNISTENIQLHLCFSFLKLNKPWIKPVNDHIVHILIFNKCCLTLFSIIFYLQLYQNG